MNVLMGVNSGYGEIERLGEVDLEVIDKSLDFVPGC